MSPWRKSPTRGSRADGDAASRGKAVATGAVRRSDDLQFLLACSEDLARSLSVSDVLTALSRNLLGRVPASRIGILLREGETEIKLVAGAARGAADDDFPHGRRLDLADYPEVARVLATGEAVEIPDVSTHALLAGSRAPLASLGIRTLLVLPLAARTGCVGVLSVAQRRGDRAFTDRQRRLMQAVASQAATALHNAQLFARLEAGSRELERTVAERTRSLRESHVRLSILAEISTAMNMSLDLDRILEAALSGLQRLDTVDVAQAWLVEGEPPRAMNAWQLDGTGMLQMTRTPIPEGEPGDWLLHVEGQPVPVGSGVFVARAHALAPLVSPDAAVGALHVFSASPSGFAETDTELLQQVAGEISIALERSRLYRREQRRRAQLEAISDIGRRITRAVALEDMLPMAAHLIRSSLGYPLACILLPDERARDLVVAGASSSHPRLAERCAGHRVPMGMGLCGHAHAQRRTINVPDVAREPRHEPMEGLMTRSEIVVPILAGGEAIGVLDIQSEEAGAFTQEDVTVLQTLADQLAAAIKLAQVFGALRRESAFTEQIINNLTAGLIVTNRLGEVRIVNQRAAEILRMEPADLAGRKLVEVLPTTAPLFVYSYEAVGRECEVELADGTVVPLGFSNSFFADATEQRDAVIITFRDLSEVRDLQRRVRHSERLATIGSVAAGVAHEIRNPLFGISATAQILVRELSDGPLRDLSREMLDETRRLNELVAQLVAFGRPHALRLADVEPARIARDAVEAVKARAAEAGVTIRVRAHDSLSVLADADQIKQVMLNLLLNAIEANPGGRVDVSVSRAGADEVAFRVRDRGPGIPPGQAEKVFDLFFTTKPHGSGIGLAISSRIVQDHGGAISATNAPDGGALFEVRLPVRRQDERTARGRGQE